MGRTVRLGSGRLCVRILATTEKGSDSSTAKLSAIGVSVRGPSEMTIIYGCPGHSRCGTLKHPHCSMAMSAEHRPPAAKFILVKR